jgi:hypothetical protein
MVALFCQHPLISMSQFQKAHKIAKNKQKDPGIFHPDLKH